MRRAIEKELSISLSPLLLGGVLALPAFGQSLDVHPFWQGNKGAWLSHNTYLGDDLNYKIKSYNSIVVVKPGVSDVVMQEIKYYPPGAFYGQAIGLNVPANSGVEFVSESRWLSTGSDGVVVENTSVQKNISTITPLTKNAALLTITSLASGNDSYRMLITLAGRNYRHTVNLGIDADSSVEADVGRLRGVSFFNGKRISPDIIPDQIEHLRKEHQVKFVVRKKPDGQFEAINIISNADK